MGRRGKFGRPFYGCSRYPKCDYATNSLEEMAPVVHSEPVAAPEKKPAAVKKPAASAEKKPAAVKKPAATPRKPAARKKSA